MSVGDIDSTLPVGQMHLVERSSDIFHQHGGVATAVQFDSLEEMSIEQFIQEVVPKLKGQPDRLTIIKDTTHEQLVRILGDNVAVYHITGIQDVFFDSFVEKLLTGEKITIRPNLRYPLIQWKICDDGKRDITVEIPPQLIEFAVAGFTEKFPIYHPRMWMRVTLTAANAPIHTKICAVPEHMDDIDSGRVCHMPFPNVHSGGEICWGSTHYETPKGVRLTEGVAIELTYRRFFNSQFNFDLLSGRDMSEFERVYDDLPKNAEIESKIAAHSGRDRDNSYCHILRMAHVLSNPEWLPKLHLQEAMSAVDFLGGSLDDE
jgi:hypothetical protein